MQRCPIYSYEPSAWVPSPSSESPLKSDFNDEYDEGSDIDDEIAELMYQGVRIREILYPWCFIWERSSLEVCSEGC